MTVVVVMAVVGGCSGRVGGCGGCVGGCGGFSVHV